MKKEETRICKFHGKTIFSLRSDGQWRCRKCVVEAVRKRRKNLKVMAVEYKGGKCIVCGYSKCIDALAFHHRDKSKKEFGISKNGYTRSWDKVKNELDKCDLMCCRCHAEKHFKDNTGE